MGKSIKSVKMSGVGPIQSLLAGMYAEGCQESHVARPRI